jgi:hypothetical protein
MALQLSTAIRNAELDAITSAIGTSGLLRFYDGTAPANVGTALSGNTLLATLPLSATAAPAASSGLLTFNAITSGTGLANGTGTFWRLLTSGGTAVAQGNLGTSGSDINLNSTGVTIGVAVSVSSLTVTAANA